MSLEVLILKIVVLLIMLSNVWWWFGKKETVLVFNLVFNRDKSKEAVGKSMGEVSSCHRYVPLKGIPAPLGRSKRRSSCWKISTSQLPGEPPAHWDSTGETKSEGGGTYHQRAINCRGSSDSYSRTGHVGDVTGQSLCREALLGSGHSQLPLNGDATARQQTYG